MKKRKILLVDDDKNVLDSLGRILWREDYELIKCENVTQAWSLVNREDGDVDVIISDNKMPDSDGTDLFVAVRKKFPHIMRIMLTGYSDLEAATKAINEGRVYKFLTKPCDSDELKLSVKQALAQRDLWLDNQK